MPTEKPYLKKRVSRTEYSYNPDFGDDRMCECGHPYYRHFDTYENMAVTGCKYCPCFWFKERRETLTGKELRYAAEHKLKVRYVERYHDPREKDKEYNRETKMEPANVGYYIGHSDINPDEFEDDQPVAGDFDEGYFAVYKVPGVVYGG